MWKRIDELLSQSDKHARLSPNSFRVWLFTLVHSDIAGVFPADARLIKSQCMPLLSTRLDQVDAAIQELDSVRLVHLFDAGSKRYLVFHDHNQWNPASNLKNQKGTYPSPPSSLCPCIGVSDGAASVPSAPVMSVDVGLRGVQGGEGVDAPPRKPKAPVSSGRDEAMRQLFALAKQQSILATDGTLTTYLDGWARRLGSAGALHEKLMDPIVVGKTVNELQDWLFPRIQQKALTPAPKSFKCGTCADTGKLPDGRGGLTPCSCVRRRAANA